MRVILAVPHFPPRHVAGAELRAYRLARWLLAQGHEVQVICIGDVWEGDEAAGLTVSEEIYDGIAVQRLGCSIAAWQGPLQGAYDNPLLLQHLGQAIASFRPDLVHLISGYLMGSAPLRAAREAGVPAVVTLTDFWFLCPTLSLLRGDGRLCWGPEPAECTRCWLNRRRPFQWLESHAPAVTRPVAPWIRRGIFVPAPWTARMAYYSRRQRSLAAELNKAHALMCITRFLAKVHVANGIDPDRFTVIPYRSAGRVESAVGPLAGGDGNGKVRFAYLGKVFPHKGVDVLVQAFRQLPESRATLTIFGAIEPASFEKRLLRMARGNSAIHFAGRYDNDRLGELLEGVDVVVAPSVWHENAPRAIVEAFQHGKPVVGSNVGGIAALVDDGRNGLLFERGNPDSLAAQMGRLLTEGALLPALRSNVRRLEVGDAENARVFAVYLRVLSGEGSQDSIGKDSRP